MQKLTEAELLHRFQQAGVGDLVKRFGLLPSKCKLKLQEFITNDPEMLEMKILVEKYSELNEPVLIIGESGTGKDIIAQALNGERPKYVALNCAAISPELIDSELFGHRCGAFTGASTDRLGLMEFAAEGTLFLDEVAELPLHLQSKLLRALQTKMIRRVGDNSEREIRCRIVCASHKDISNPDYFRPDLYWRICTYTVRLKPLRERRDDIHEMLDAKLDKEGILDEAERDVIAAMELPGNFRELESVVKRKILEKILNFKHYKV